MHTIKTIAALSLLAVTAACVQPSGYYDSHGVYHVYGSTSDTERYDHPIGETSTTSTIYPAQSDNGTTVVYDRPYDTTYYNSGMRIPQTMLPPHGYCRIWLNDRPASAQPPIESCSGIEERAPEDSFVVYGK